MSILVALTTLAVTQQATPQITLSDRELRVSDLAIVSEGGGLIIGRLPEGVESVTITPDAAEKLVASRLPGRPVHLRFDTSMIVTAPLSSGANGPTCYIANSDLRAGEVIGSSDVAPGDCLSETVRPPLAYDRIRMAPIARQPISKGTYLGPVRAAPGTLVAPGQRLVFRTFEGSVLVEREVSAMQAGRSGSALFARTEDGEVIAADLALPVADPEAGE